MRRPVAILALAALSVGCAPATRPTPADSPTLPPSSAPEASASPPPTAAASPTASAAALAFEVESYAVTPGSHPHDVSPAADGGVWYTGQGNGTLGWLDPETGDVREIPLGSGSAPHGVITGPDGDAWITDGGLNAIVRVDAATDAVTVFPVAAANANLNTATFDGDGILWFTGQNGIYGSLDPTSGAMRLFDAPRGRGPYGIAATPDGEVVYSSLAGSYLALIDRASGEVTVVDTPTPGGGARRVWSDSSGGLWATEWFSGSLAAYDTSAETWREFALPTDAPMPYAVFVDDQDAVWVTDFGANAIHRFDPADEAWLSFELESQPAEVRQLLGRPGEVWGAESAADRLVVVRTTGG